MLGSPSTRGKASRTFAASSSYLHAAPLCLLGLLIVSGAALGVTSASAGPSAFPGRNGRILLEQRCAGGGEANGSSCGQRYVTLNADGSSFRVLRDSKKWYSARWSPDGRRILVRAGLGPGELPTTIAADLPSAISGRQPETELSERLRVATPVPAHVDGEPEKDLDTEEALQLPS